MKSEIKQHLTKKELIIALRDMEKLYGQVYDRLRVVEHELTKVQYVITKLHLKREEQVKLGGQDE